MSKQSTADRLNRCRWLYREGQYERALVLGQRSLEEIDHAGPGSWDASDLEYGLDAATLVGLIQRGLGDDDAAWATLASIFPRRCPGLAEPSFVVAEIRDDERQRNVVFGQMVLFELGAEYLLEADALRTQARWCRQMAEASRVPLLEMHVHYLEAWMARVDGHPHDAIQRWINHAHAAERALRTAVVPAGYPPSRALAQAALTAEAVDDQDELDDLLRHARRGPGVPRTWEDTLLRSIEVRRHGGRARRSPRFPWAAADAELIRLQAEIWLWELGGADGDDVARARRAVGDSPPAAVLGIVARMTDDPDRFGASALAAAQRWFEGTECDESLGARQTRRPSNWPSLVRMRGVDRARLLVI